MFFRKAVLVIHGFVGATYDNENLVNYLEYQGGLDVYAFTLPGHDSSSMKGIEYQDWITRSENQLEYLIKRYSTVYVIGHSMGGVIASILATKYPQVKKLILVAPAFEYLSITQNTKDLTNISKIIKDDNNPDAYRLVLAKATSVPMPTVVQFIKLVKEYKTIIKDVKIPTLIIHGDTDEVIPLKSSQYAYNNVGTNEKYLTVVKNVRHAVFRSSRNREISEYVYQFLKGGLRWKSKYKSTL